MVKLAVYACGLVLMMGSIVFLGCKKAQPAPSLGPSGFHNSCRGDIIKIGFPAQFMVAGPSASTSSDEWSSGSGGTCTVMNLGTYASTPAEAEEMMRKFCQELQKVAEEKGCRVENPPDLPEKGPVANFKFTYTYKATNRGEVTVTRTERADKNLQVPGKQVYTVKVEVMEKIAKAP